jgi:hypothetical protein
MTISYSYSSIFENVFTAESQRAQSNLFRFALAGTPLLFSGAQRKGKKKNLSASFATRMSAANGR